MSPHTLIMSDKINEILTGQNRLRIKIQNIFFKYASRREVPEERRHICAVQAELQRLKDYYNIFESNHEKVLKCKDYDPFHEYFTSAFLTDVENSYCEKKKPFYRIILNLVQSHVHSPTVKHSTNLSTSPPKKPPEFSGRSADWGIFRDSFKTVIHDIEKLTDLNRFCYLMTGVHGKALDIARK